MPQGVGTLITVSQSVVKQGAGSLVTLEQTISFSATGAGSLVTLEQSITTTGSGSLVTIAQKIRGPELSALDKYGFDADLYIGGSPVSPDQIHGQIDITRTENSAALMNVTLINKTGTIDIAEFHGKQVFLNIETSNGIERIYTGTVDIPEFDLINKLTTLRCTDKRKELINNQLSGQLSFIGRWSSAIFEEPDDVADELSQRLQTTTKTVDFDAYGNFTVSDFLPKATPDFTLSASDIYRRKPTLQVASRGRLVNRVAIEFDYRFVRLRHRERNFQLDGPSFCDVMTTQGLSFLSVNGIKANLDSFGWDVKESSISYTYLPPGGWYNCGSFGRPFLWSPIVNQGETTTVKDSDGNVVTDSNGNPITETRITTSTDYTKAFATSATWIAAKRFAQDINQKINIVVNAPQSQNQYGIIEKKQRNGLQVDFDTIDFEGDNGYQPPTDMIATSTDFYLDKNGSESAFNDAINTVIDIAKTTIAKTHRDNHVTIETDIWPAIDLKHTVHVNTGLINAKGKVSLITHSIDINNRFADTTVRLSLSKATGTQADGTLSITRFTAPLVGDNYSGTLKMRTYGAYTPGFGNSGNVAKEQGLVTPAIDNESRNKQETVNNYSVDIAIRDDTLQVNY